MFSQWADLARREGLLALESKASEIEDPFLKNGLTLAIDGQNADYIRDVLTEEVEAMEERHTSGARYFYTSRYICTYFRGSWCSSRVNRRIG